MGKKSARSEINLLYIASQAEKDGEEEVTIRNAFVESGEFRAFALTPAFDARQADQLLAARTYDFAVLAHDRMPWIHGETPSCYSPAYSIALQVREKRIPLVVLVNKADPKQFEKIGATVIAKSQYIQAALAACQS